MRLANIDLETLEVIHYRSAAIRRAKQRGRRMSRQIYKDSQYAYKIWSRGSRGHRVAFVAGEAVFCDNRGAAGEEQLLGFLCGMYDDKICPAFVENIYSRGRLRGYRTRLGEPLSKANSADQNVRDFIEEMINASLRSGYVYRDLHPGNLIRLGDGRISLIDLETPIAELRSLDLNLEIQNGSLRRGIFLKYRQFILDHFDSRNQTGLDSPALNSVGSGLVASMDMINSDKLDYGDLDFGISENEDPATAQGLRGKRKNYYGGTLAWIDEARKMLASL